MISSKWLLIKVIKPYQSPLNTVIRCSYHYCVYIWNLENINKISKGHGNELIGICIQKHETDEFATGNVFVKMRDGRNSLTRTLPAWK